jgi:hypothetical protein
MRRSLALALLALAAPATLTAQSAQKADTAAVLATLEGFTAALRAKDSLGMRALLHEQARFTLLRPAQGGGVRVMILDAATFPRLTSDPKGPTYDEPIRNPKVTIDGDLATVWAEYQVRLQGKVSHCGYDAFDLVRHGNGWKILNVSDTFRREGCGPMW